MDEKNFMEINEDLIDEINQTLKYGFGDYKLKNSSFSKDSFRNNESIILLQSVGEEVYELNFKTAFEDGKYYISSSFNVICDDLLNGRQSRDVFYSVNEYFHDVVENPDNDFSDEMESLVNFLLLSNGDYLEADLRRDLNPSKIISDYTSDRDKIYLQDDLTDIQKSLALKELLHMSICQVVNDIDLFFTRPFDLSPAENHEKNRQEVEALKNDLKWS